MPLYGRTRIARLTQWSTQGGHEPWYVGECSYSVASFSTTDAPNLYANFQHDCLHRGCEAAHNALCRQSL